MGAEQKVAVITKLVITAASMSLATVLAQPADAAGSHDPQKHTHASVVVAAAVADQTKVNATKAALRDLWIGHVFWVRNVVVAGLAGDVTAQQTAEKQVVGNAQSIAGSIEPFYGAAKEKLLAIMRAVGNFLGLLRHASRRERTHFGGNAVSGSAVSPFNVVDEAHPDVLVVRAPVGQDVHSVTGRVGFACADFQRSRAHWAQGRGLRQHHDCLHASQQPDPARATRRESMSGRASHRSSKNIFVQKLLKTKFSHCSFVSTV
jgi:hypothetical protein